MEVQAAAIEISCAGYYRMDRVRKKLEPHLAYGRLCILLEGVNLNYKLVIAIQVYVETRPVSTKP